MKKYLRIILRSPFPLWYDYELPEGASLLNMVAQMQLSGYFLAPTFWIPIGSIAHMCILETAASENSPVMSMRMN